MKKIVRICVPLIFCLLFIMTADSTADTIRLYQGSVMVGKIISEDKTSIVLANYFGTFRIKRIKIDDIYKTNSFMEDIAIHKKLNLPYNDKEIIIHYAAGRIKKKEKSMPKYEEQNPGRKKTGKRTGQTCCSGKEKRTGTPKKSNCQAITGQAAGCHFRDPFCTTWETETKCSRMVMEVISLWTRGWTSLQGTGTPGSPGSGLKAGIYISINPRIPWRDMLREAGSCGPCRP